MHFRRRRPRIDHHVMIIFDFDGTIADSLDPREMIYVGDEVRDVKAAHKAGVNIAGVTWGFNTRRSLAELEPRWLLSDPEDLSKLIPLKNERPHRNKMDLQQLCMTDFLSDRQDRVTEW
ncbi:MAG: HAD hydrolase-like protein [Akkermansiaceae bacterium]